MEGVSNVSSPSASSSGGSHDQGQHREDGCEQPADMSRTSGHSGLDRPSDATEYAGHGGASSDQHRESERGSAKPAPVIASAWRPAAEPGRAARIGVTAGIISSGIGLGAYGRLGTPPPACHPNRGCDRTSQPGGSGHQVSMSDADRSASKASGVSRARARARRRIASATESASTT